MANVNLEHFRHLAKLFECDSCDVICPKFFFSIICSVNITAWIEHAWHIEYFQTRPTNMHDPPTRVTGKIWSARYGARRKAPRIEASWIKAPRDKIPRLGYLLSLGGGGFVYGAFVRRAFVRHSADTPNKWCVNLDKIKMIMNLAAFIIKLTKLEIYQSIELKIRMML